MSPEGGLLSLILRSVGVRVNESLSLDSELKLPVLAPTIESMEKPNDLLDLTTEDGNTDMVSAARVIADIYVELPSISKASSSFNSHGLRTRSIRDEHY